MNVGVVDDNYYTEYEAVRVPTFRRTAEYTFTLARQIHPTTNATAQTKYPWIKYLPYESAQFSIDYPQTDGTFYVTLAPDLLTASTKSDFGQTSQVSDVLLSADKKAALAWLKAQGADVSQLKISWLPYDPDNPPK